MVLNFKYNNTKLWRFLSIYNTKWWYTVSIHGAVYSTVDSGQNSNIVQYSSTLTGLCMAAVKKNIFGKFNLITKFQTSSVLYIPENPIIVGTGANTGILNTYPCHQQVCVSSSW